MQFWNTARATYVEDLDDQLKKLDALALGSANAALETPIQYWCKAYFDSKSKCDIVDNNTTEVFNRWILEIRCKNIISMLKEIRHMVMERMIVKRSFVQNWRTNIAPKALEKLEKNMLESMKCRLAWNGDGGFEIVHKEDQHTISLKSLKCTCRAWDLSGIQCPHAICAMYHDKKNPDVAEWYLKDKYLAGYKYSLQLVRGKKFWPKDNDPIQPPHVRKMPGRPQKQRRKGKDEPIKHNGKWTKRDLKTRFCGFFGTCLQLRDDSSTSGTQAQPKKGKEKMQQKAPYTKKKQTTEKRKGFEGIGIYTNLRNGEQVWNPGKSNPITIFNKRKIGAVDSSAFNHVWKVPGLKWKGKQATALRKLHEEKETMVSKKGKKNVVAPTIGTQGSQT
ncbi:hypothetical protein REPUB_Repub10bG0114000 [Reevesia pubescens]